MVQEPCMTFGPFQLTDPELVQAKSVALSKDVARSSAVGNA